LEGTALYGGTGNDVFFVTNGVGILKGEGLIEIMAELTQDLQSHWS